MDTEETFFLALKTHRESKGIQIDEISDYTKINPKYLNAIEDGNFNIIPNIYMRLFIRSYAKYIDADYKQTLVDYELYTTGKIQPKFFESNQDNQSDKEKMTTSNNADFGDDFQVNYKQIITIALTIIAIYLGFKLVEYISNDDSNQNTEITVPPTSSDLNEINNSISKTKNPPNLSLLTNEDFRNSSLVHEVTEIIPLALNKANLKIKTLDRTKVNLLTHHKNGAVFF